MNYRKGFMSSPLLAVIAFLIIGSGVYVYKNQKISETSSTAAATYESPSLSELTPYRAMHFTIGLPEGWTANAQTESGDNIIFYNPEEPDVYISIFTVKVDDTDGTWPKLEDRWQFSGRNAVPFIGDDGLEGIAAEGPRSTNPATQILAVGYQMKDNYLMEDSWDMIAEAGAPKEQFKSIKPLFTAMLKSLKPDPVPR